MPLQRTKTVYTSLDSTLSCPSSSSSSSRSGRLPLPVSDKTWTQTNSTSSNTSSVPSSLSNTSRDLPESSSSFSYSQPQAEHTDRHAYTCPQFSLGLDTCSILRPTEDGSIYFSPKHPQLDSHSRPHSRGSEYDGTEEHFPAIPRGVTA